MQLEDPLNCPFRSLLAQGLSSWTSTQQQTWPEEPTVWGLVTVKWGLLCPHIAMCPHSGADRLDPDTR